MFKYYLKFRVIFLANMSLPKLHESYHAIQLFRKLSQPRTEIHGNIGTVTKGPDTKMTGYKWTYYKRGFFYMPYEQWQVFGDI